jgi:hypothetical protein
VKTWEALCDARKKLPPFGVVGEAGHTAGLGKENGEVSSMGQGDRQNATGFLRRSPEGVDNLQHNVGRNGGGISMPVQPDLIQHLPHHAFVNRIGRHCGQVRLNRGAER